jgi:hypothetical protein
MVSWTDLIHLGVIAREGRAIQYSRVAVVES